MILEDLQKEDHSLNAIIQAEGELKIAEDELQFALMDKQDAKYREKALGSVRTKRAGGRWITEESIPAGQGKAKMGRPPKKVVGVSTSSLTFKIMQKEPTCYCFSSLLA